MLKTSKHNKLGHTRFPWSTYNKPRKSAGQINVFFVFEPSFMGRNKTVAFFSWKMQLLLTAQIGRRGVCYQSHSWRSLPVESTFIPQVFIWAQNTLFHHVLLEFYWSVEFKHPWFITYFLHSHPAVRPAPSTITAKGKVNSNVHTAPQASV